jgi:uncharacterized protein GlcG (DUF336 family)
MTITNPSQVITREGADRLLAAAVAKATEIGTASSVAVVDAGGQLKAFVRMDGAALMSGQVARDKAYTAVGFGVPTDAWPEFLRSDEGLGAGAVGAIERLVVFGGGVPLQVGADLVGGVGVSGGTPAQDSEIAAAAAAALSQ